MKAKSRGQIAGIGSLAILGLAAAEVLIMMTPFAGFFYGSLRFEPLLGWLGRSRATAWLDGFFLNHSVVTDSALLEWQREIGDYLLLLGLLGFAVSAALVYGGKATRAGVATGSLYRWVRHPQYACFAVAGWGILVSWPRFLLLGGWVTMLFLYSGLARFEERRMEERFESEYRGFAATRGALLPGSPVRRLFEATFGRMRPRPLGWALAYVFCLLIAFSLAFALRGYTIRHSAIQLRPQDRTAIVSVWPQPGEWMERVVAVARSEPQVMKRLSSEADDVVLVATILPSRYGMKDMYYRMASLETRGSEPTRVHAAGFAPPILSSFMGRNPAVSEQPVEVVFSRVGKGYKERIELEEVLDPGVLLTPLLVVTVSTTSDEATRVRVPLPQNAWGATLVMPLF